VVLIVVPNVSGTTRRFSLAMATRRVPPAAGWAPDRRGVAVRSRRWSGGLRAGWALACGRTPGRRASTRCSRVRSRAG